MTHELDDKTAELVKTLESILEFDVQDGYTEVYRDDTRIEVRFWNIRDEDDRDECVTINFGPGRFLQSKGNWKRRQSDNL